MYESLEETFAPQEVPSRTSWGCEHPQFRTAVLRKQNISFRGHREDFDSKNKVTFLKL